MASDDHLTLKGIATKWRADSLGNQIEESLTRWLKWAFLEIYGYVNVTRTSPSTTFVQDATPLYQLVRAKDENYTDGRTYQSFASDWVWETGLAQGGTPQVAQIYVNGSLKTTGDATYGHRIDYPRGRVVFDSVINNSDDVEANFAFRTPSFVSAELPWFQELMFDMFRVDEAEFLASFTSGRYSQLAETRRQLPVVGIELVDRKASQPYELGNGVSKWRFQDVLFHIFADNKSDVKAISDKLEAQDDKAIYLVDTDALREDSGFPHDLNYQGELVTSPSTYPTIITDFRAEKGVFANTSIQKLPPINYWLHRAIVRTTFTAIT